MLAHPQHPQSTHHHSSHFASFRSLFNFRLYACRHLYVLVYYLRIHAHFPVMFWCSCLPTIQAIYGKQYISQLVNKCRYGACTWLMLAEHCLVNISTRTACRLPRNAHWSFCQAFLWMADVTGIALVSCCRLSPILWAFAAIAVFCWCRCVRISTCGFWSVVNWITSKSTYSYPPWRL